VRAVPLRAQMCDYEHRSAPQRRNAYRALSQHCSQRVRASCVGVVFAQLHSATTLHERCSYETFQNRHTTPDDASS
jgi:hypothetical protein